MTYVQMNPGRHSQSSNEVLPWGETVLGGHSSTSPAAGQYESIGHGSSVENAEIAADVINNTVTMMGKRRMIGFFS
jgi:hypothetical protein